MNVSPSRLLLLSAGCFVGFLLLHGALFRLAVLLRGPEYGGRHGWLPFKDRLALAREVGDSISDLGDLSDRFRGILYALATVDAVAWFVCSYAGWLALCLACMGWIRPDLLAQLAQVWRATT